MSDDDWGNETLDFSNTTGEKFFTKRRNQLDNAKSVYFPDVMALFSELIQNSDDAKSKELVLGFTKEALYISNDGTSFNMGATRNQRGEMVGGDLESLSEIGERKKTNFVDSSTGVHGTGFELIYYIANQFEVHWYNLEGEERENGILAHAASQPEELARGQARWKIGKKGDDWRLKPLYIKNKDKTRRGVTFKAPWRSQEDREIKYDHDQPFLSSSSFFAWDDEKICELFEQCKTYLPFMSQFCKHLTRIELYLVIDDKKIEIHEIERSKAYPDSSFEPPNRYGSESKTITITNYLIKNALKLKDIWGHANNENENSSGIEIIRSIKFNEKFSNLKSSAESTNEILKFLHYWGPVYSNSYSNHGNNLNGIDKEIILSCWRSRGDINKIHNCSGYLSSKTMVAGEGICQNCPRTYDRSNWKIMRRPTVHINFPLFDIDKYLEKFRDPNKTFISSIMPLAMMTSNKFFVSGDFHVKESRQDFKSDIMEEQVWNHSVANSIFELTKHMYADLYDDICSMSKNVNDEPNLLYASRNCVPENLEKWFKLPNLGPYLSSGSWEKTHEDFIHGSDGMLNAKLIQGYTALKDSNQIYDFFMPSEIIIPLDEKNLYSETLSTTLVEIGLPVIHQDVYDAIFESNFEIAKSLKERLERNSPYSKSITEDTERKIKQALLNFGVESTTDNQSVDVVHLAKLSEHFFSSDSENHPKTYVDESGEFCAKSEFVDLPDDWNLFKEVYPDLRTIHPNIEPYVSVDEINIEIALNLFKITQPNLSDNSMLISLVNFANKLLDSEDSPKVKREISFIPVQYQGRWMLRPDNHLKKCNTCEFIQPWRGLEAEEEEYCCANCGEKTEPTREPVNTSRSQTDLQTVSRSFVYKHSDMTIPELIEENLFIAHEGIRGGGSIREANKRAALFNCSSIKLSKSSPGQTTFFDHKVIRELLGMTNNRVTEEMVQSALIEFFELYSDVITSNERFNVCSDLKGDEYGECLYDENGKFFNHKEFILHISPNVRELIKTDENPLRALHPDILQIESKKEGFHWLANDNSSMLKIKKNVSHELIYNTIESLVREYGAVLTEDGKAKTFESKLPTLKRLSEIVMLILKSELTDKKYSLLNNLKLDNELWPKFENLKWVPLGSQVGITEELVKWSEFYVPGSEFWKVWGTMNREHQVLESWWGDSEPLKSHTYFSDEDWEWLVANADTLVNNSQIRATPTPNRMVYTLFNWFSDEIINWMEIDIESTFTKELFDHINKLSRESIEEIKSAKEKFNLNIPTREKFVHNPSSHGGTEDFEFSETIFPLDSKSVDKSWIPSLRSILEKFGVNDLWKNDDALFDQYYAISDEKAGNETTEDERKFITKLLRKYISTFNGDWERMRLRTQELNRGSGGTTYILPGKDRCYECNDIYFEKDNPLSKFKSKLDFMVEINKENGGIFNKPKEARDLIDCLKLPTLDEVFNGDFGNASRGVFGGIIGTCDFTIDEAREWNRILLENCQNMFNNGKLDVTSLAIIKNNDVHFVKSSNDFCYLVEKDIQITRMLMDAGVSIIPIDHSDRERSELYRYNLERLLELSPNIEHEIISEPVVGRGKAVLIPNFKEYMSDLYRAIQHMSELEDSRLANYRNEIERIADMKNIEAKIFDGQLEIKHRYNSRSVNIRSNHFFVYSQDEFTIVHDFENKIAYDPTRSKQQVALEKMIRNWLGEHSGNVEFADECLKQISPLLNRNSPLEWPDIEKSKLGNIWEDEDPSCMDELILNRNKREATQAIKDTYISRGCNLCNKRTPNRPDSIHSFEEKKITLIRRDGQTRYSGDDNNSIGNMLYLCPNHSHSYRKKCVKIELRFDDEWIEIRNQRLQNLAKNQYGINDLRFSVWESASADLDIFEDDDEGDGIDWHNIELSPLVENGWITEDHASQLISTAIDWINQQR